MPAYRFEPARVSSGLQVSRKTGLTIGASLLVVMLAIAGYLVLRPTPPSATGTVADYFADLGRGDTAAALALVANQGVYSSPQEAPLLVPAALAKEANRPTGAKVTSSRAGEDEDGSRITAVTVTYKVAGHSVSQQVEVASTADKKKPFLLEEPFLFLTVGAPDGMDATVNGIAVDDATLSQGTVAFPGAYRATTSGNVFYAGSTQAATYQAGDDGLTASIDFGQPALAPGAPQAVQAAAQQYLDANCVTSTDASDGYQCPLRAPYDDYNQTTVWTIPSYPQVQLSSTEEGQNELQFTTTTPGSAKYTVTYFDYNGTSHTDAGTVPVDISGYAQIGDDGSIQITLGY
jgi:hypothetical protein